MYNNLYLAHHGVKGQRWGIRRYQNYDGTMIKKNAKYELDDSAARKNKISEAVKNEYNVENAMLRKYTTVKNPKKMNYYDRQETLSDIYYEMSNDDKRKMSKLYDEKYEAERSRLFVSGSSKTQTSDSGYFRKKLPREVRKYLNYEMKKRTDILVGDAPGIDRQVQDYLKKKRYMNVEVYSPGKTNRYSADKNWKINYVNSNHPEGSKEWLREKDIAMTNRATKGFAVRLDEGSTATRNNIDRLASQNKNVKIYELDKRGRRHDKWV